MRIVTFRSFENSSKYLTEPKSQVPVNMKTLLELSYLYCSHLRKRLLCSTMSNIYMRK